MPFQYKHVLMIGATSGIGAAMAHRLVQEGSKVIAVGRRQDRLDDFVQKHGKDKASAVRFDISNRQNMDGFVTNVTKSFPDLDCVFLNAGAQSPVNLAEPAGVDLARFHSEVTLNFSCFVDLTMKFLPFLSKKTEASVIYTSSNLAIVPATALPAYSASKAALNAFILCLRDQLGTSSVKIIELLPPPVQTELHDYMGEEKGRQLGMPLDDFTAAAYEGLSSGSDQVIIGSIGPADTFHEIVDKRRNAFQDLTRMMRGLQALRLAAVTKDSILGIQAKVIHPSDQVLCEERKFHSNTFNVDSAPGLGLDAIASIMPSASPSKALTKRSLDTSLMPPPPLPKRIKRPAKVLDEDEYTDALSHIIARDFFPGLLETESKQEYLDALDSQDSQWIAAAGRKLNEVMTPGPDGRKLRGRRGTSMTPSSGLFGRGGETPKMWQGDTPMSVVSTAASTTSTNSEKPEVDTNMSLGAFQQKYTSEDNESFYKLLDKQNQKRADKYAWMWNGNKIPAPRQIAHQKRERLLTASRVAEDAENGGKQLAVIEPADKRKAMPDTWKSRPDNPFMFAPASVEDSVQTVAQKAEEISTAPPKAVVYDNTRMAPPSTITAGDPSVPPSPSLSAIKDAIAGRPRPTASEVFAGASTPRVNGYAYVDSELDTESTYDRSPLLLGSGDSTPNPFKLSESSKREALHHRMVDKVAKGKRVTGKREAELKTPVPRFASSPRIAKGGMTPAAQRLMGKVGGLAATPRGLWEGKTPRTSGLREGWTPKTVEKNKD